MREQAANLNCNCTKKLVANQARIVLDKRRYHPLTFFSRRAIDGPLKMVSDHQDRQWNHRPLDGGSELSPNDSPADRPIDGPTELVPGTPSDSRHLAKNADIVPDIILAAGGAGRFAWEEFFFGRIRNPHTRKAYHHAVSTFITWCEKRRIELSLITPSVVGHYFDEHPGAIATRKLHLSALRHFFDQLVMRHVVVLNPALSVRGERYQVLEGKTPEITVAQARHLLASIDTENVVGLRDRAVISLLIYTAARVGAVAKLRLRHFYHSGDQYLLHFEEKGGKSREIPVRHNLQQYLLSYIEAAGIAGDGPDTPLFRTAVRRQKHLTENPMTANDMCRMVKRRLKESELPTRLSPHSFRVATITDLLLQGVPLEDVQFLVGHSDPRTTRLYDRRQQRVTRNIVERISV